MNTVFGEIMVPSAKSRNAEVATIVGTLPLHRPTKRIVMTDGTVCVNKTETAIGKVVCHGKLTLNAICEDSEDKLFSFSATADFTHTMECESADVGMHSVISAQLSEIKAHLSGDNIELNASADIMCRIEDNSEKRMLKSGEGTEILTKCFAYKKRESVGVNTTRLREELAANNVSSIIYVDADAIIRDISSVMDTARVDGILNLNALCYDRDGGFVWLKQNIPFAVDVETAFDNCTDLTGTVSVSDVRLRMTEDEYGLATLDAQLKVEIFAATENNVELTCDAFSPVEPFDCVKTDLQLLLYKETIEQKGLCKETVRLNEIEEFSSCVFGTARPIVSSATKGDGCIIVDGMLQCNLLYLSKSGELKLKNDELPYSVNVPTEYENTEIDAHPVCTSVNVAAVNENGVEVSVGIHLMADIYELCDISAVTDTKKAERKESAKGFVVCFVSDDESLYDIAKRFNVSKKSLVEANPDLNEKLHAGDKAILLR